MREGHESDPAMPHRVEDVVAVGGKPLPAAGAGHGLRCKGGVAGGSEMRMEQWRPSHAPAPVPHPCMAAAAGTATPPGPPRCPPALLQRCWQQQAGAWPGPSSGAGSAPHASCWTAADRLEGCAPSPVRWLGSARSERGGRGNCSLVQGRPAKTLGAGRSQLLRVLFSARTGFVGSMSGGTPQDKSGGPKGSASTGAQRKLFFVSQKACRRIRTGRCPFDLLSQLLAAACGCLRALHQQDRSERRASGLRCAPLPADNGGTALSLLALELADLPGGVVRRVSQ